jgi:hypothetical protein
MYDNQPFYFLLTWKDRHDNGFSNSNSNSFYTMFDLKPVYLTDEGQAIHFGSWDGAKGLGLTSLVISASLSCRRNKEDFLNWETKFENPWEVGLERAEAMVKTLKAVRAGLDKAIKRDGYPVSFGQYVLRIVRALGAAGVLIQDEDAFRHDGREAYCQRTAGEVANTVDYQVQSAKWRAQEALKDAEVLV